MIYDPLLEQVISSRLLLAQASKEKLADKPEVQEEIARARDDVLRNSLLQQAIGKATTEDKLQAAYAAQKSQPGFAAEEVHAQHILVGSEAEARDIIAQLTRARTSASSPRTSRPTRVRRRTRATSATSSATPWCRSSRRPPSRWSRAR